MNEPTLRSPTQNVNRPERTPRGSLAPKAAIIALLALITLSLVTACATLLGAGAVDPVDILDAIFLVHDRRYELAERGRKGQPNEQAKRAAADFLIVSSPVISPANDMVVFQYCREEDGCRLAAYVFESGKTFLLEKPEDEDWFTPAISPDGKQVAFSRGPRSSWSTQIAIMNADGTHLRTLTTGIGDASSPSFSRDGRRLLYLRGLNTPETRGTSRRKSVTGLDVYEIDLTSGSETRLTKYSFYGMTRASYYRDVNTIIFSGRGPTPPAHYFRKGREKAFMDLTKKTMRGLIYVLGRSQSAELPVPDLEFSEEVSSPSLSLDGTRIVYLMQTNKMDGVKQQFFNYDLFARINGATVRLTKMGSYITHPSIAPDGTWVVFCSDSTRRKQWELWRVNPDGSGLSQLKIAPEPAISRGLPR